MCKITALFSCLILLSFPVSALATDIQNVPPRPPPPPYSGPKPVTSSTLEVTREYYKGNNPPSIDIITRNVLLYGGQQVKGIKIIGLHKERDGSLLIITDRDSNRWGGPYKLLRLENNDWVMTKPGELFNQYVLIIK